MAGAALKIEGSEVALGAPGGTVINISLRQESGAAYLCKGVAFLGRRIAAAKGGTGAPSARRPGGGEQKVLGGVQILLGAACIGLGVILSLAPSPLYADYYYYARAVDNGVPFWMGSLFILSGSFSVVGARHGGKWVHLATFLHLGSVVAGSVAFTLGLTQFPLLNRPPYFIEQLCKHRAEERESWGPPTSPPKENPRDEQRATECQEALWALVRMWSSTQILLLILHSLALMTAVFCFGYGLHRLVRSCWGSWTDYMAVEEAEGPPAPKEPSKEQNPA